jgi:hypothetical protein
VIWALEYPESVCVETCALDYDGEVRPDVITLESAIDDPAPPFGHCMVRERAHGWAVEFVSLGEV